MRNLPTVTKNILLITVLCLFGTVILSKYGIDCNGLFGLHYVTAMQFHIWQPLTYMFLHGSFWHLFCNMFAVFMFAPALEERWGSRRFLIFYLVCGVGAALVQEVVWALQLQPTLSGYEWEVARILASRYVTIGASGAVFGILFAFAWLFPEVRLFILFIPIPVRARVVVIGYMVFELFAGFSSLPGDKVAHFAHLGGALFGWLLLLWWRHRRYSGFEKGEMSDSHIRFRFRQQWHRFRCWWQQHVPCCKRFPRIRRDKSKEKTQDYSDYHYHESVK